MSQLSEEPSPPATTAPGSLGIFICYRHDDTGPRAGRIGDELCRQFGRENVFFDFDSVFPGTNFETAIEQALGRCDVLLVVIGSDWLVVGANGSPRLQDPHDWVRLEIDTAIRQKLSILPVLVDDARMPAARDMPATIALVSSIQALSLPDRNWHANVETLVQLLRRLPPRKKGAAPAVRSYGPEVDDPDENQSGITAAPSSQPQPDDTARQPRPEPRQSVVTGPAAGSPTPASGAAPSGETPWYAAVEPAPGRPLPPPEWWTSPAPAQPAVHFGSPSKEGSGPAGGPVPDASGAIDFWAALRPEPPVTANGPMKAPAPPPPPSKPAPAAPPAPPGPSAPPGPPAPAALPPEPVGARTPSQWWDTSSPASSPRPAAAPRNPVAKPAFGVPVAKPALDVPPPRPVPPSGPALRDIRPLASWTVTALRVYALLFALTMVTEILMGHGNGFKSQPALVATLVLSTLIVGSLFIAWLHRVVSNGQQLVGRRLRYGPGWALSSWFIPVAQLWLPYRVVADLWRTVLGAEPGPGAAVTTVPRWLARWWASTVLAGVLLFGGLFSGALAVAGDAVAIVGTLSAIKVVRETTARQQPQLGTTQEPK